MEIEGVKFVYDSRFDTIPPNGHYVGSEEGVSSSSVLDGNCHGLEIPHDKTDEFIEKLKIICSNPVEIYSFKGKDPSGKDIEVKILGSQVPNIAKHLKDAESVGMEGKYRKFIQQPKRESNQHS